MLDAQATPQAILLKDYQPPRFLIPEIQLDFDLGDTATRVTSRFTVVRNGTHKHPLALDGRDLTLVSVSVDGNPLAAGDYRLTREQLVLPLKNSRADIEIVTQVNPAANTQLMGLYMSGGIFCTQCEAEGFRRITYFLDRPDVMSRYRTTIRADRMRFPVLLSNGNPAGAGELPGGRHWATWDDPFPKPCYLFALVAGDLKPFSDRFVTASGREVQLAIWVKEHDLGRCAHAMEALKKSMRWDEERYGREYDLDVFNIVAVGDFNFGAMENKGLNIFNSKYVLAAQDTATDMDFDAVESVIAHEYFHNWTGNRVTCRDWFQLSLKEGLTVFRDQEFSADHGSRALKRIEDVRTLRAGQFPEDSGPLAHPVRPESYIEISNFYTATVYNKGAEVIRMLATLLGEEKFRAGCDLYFSRHDGQAVTCDDFVAAMEEAGGVDLGQFKLWYSQAGTPHLEARLDYDAAAGTATLKVKQTIPDTPGQTGKKPMHIPLRVALFGAQSGRNLTGDRLVELRQAEETVVFDGLTERPVPSLLRGFSAPVVLKAPMDRSDLAFLARHDDDPFARFEAMQRLGLDLMLEQVNANAAGRPVSVAPVLVETVEAILREALDGRLDPALAAEAVTLPSESYVGDQMAIVDVDGIHTVRQLFRRTLTAHLRPLWWDVYRAMQDAAYAFTPAAKARRRLKNTALQYLMAEPAAEAAEAVAACVAQFRQADNMTDRIAALGALVNSDAPERETALQTFYDDWANDALVIDKWFMLQAHSIRPDTLEQVTRLTRHPAFTLTNPNRLRALVGAFSMNQVRFHAASGGGYRYLGDQVIAVDKLNPQTAARLVAPLGRWQRFDQARAALMRGQLERILGVSGLSKDVYEMVSKSLG
ncbi:aminopeptidase N [Pedomonas sp. V897]|uniref:aminopeptidase N n=1 Tax=Pedomonas sp. V897 TaxID=3446482 RepID=UPI003EDE7A02